MYRIIFFVLPYNLKLYYIEPVLRVFNVFSLFLADISSEQLLVQRLAELQVKLQYLDSIYRSRQEDLQQLTQHIDQMGTPGDNSSLLPPSTLRPEIRQLLRNMSGLNAANG